MPDFQLGVESLELVPGWHVRTVSQAAVCAVQLYNGFAKLRGLKWKLVEKKRTFLFGGVQSHFERTARVLGDFGGY